MSARLYIVRPGSLIAVTEGIGVWYWSTTIYGSDRDHYYHGYACTRWGAKRLAKRARRNHY